MSFSFGGTPTQNAGTAAAPTLFGSAQPAAAKPTLFGGGLAAPAAKTMATVAPAFGTAAATTGFSLGATPAKQPAPGLNLSSSTGFSVGAAAKPAGAGFSFGATPNAATAATGVAPTGFGTLGAAKPGGLTLGAAKPAGTILGTAPATTGLTLGAGFGTGLSTGLGGTAVAKPGLGLGGLSTVASTTGLGVGLGGATLAATASKGLGGADPKTSTTLSSTGVGGLKSSESKAVKEMVMPNQISATVKSFENYVNQQKGVREEIARMSSKQIYKVQEEVASLKQLLSLVTNKLQRNSFAIQKLKQESVQELKHAEMAHRTKDTPPGLQYENTAPTDYFAQLAVDFEQRMEQYRQQIEEMESHLASLNQPALITPQELSFLLAKLHESFVGLAAQLQVVHEAVKAQKEHYINYRKIFYGDPQDVFEKRRKTQAKIKESRCITTTVGPTPFTGMSNAAAVAMATALNRTQPTAGGAPTMGLNSSLVQPTGTGLFGGGSTGFGAAATGFGTAATGFGTASTGFGAASTGFGAASTGLSSGFGSSTFGTGTGTNQASNTLTTGFGFQPSNTATVRPLGSTFGSGATGFGASAATGTPGTVPFTYGATPVATPQGTPQVGFGAPAFGAPVANQPFQLQKPPIGNKRGKKT